MKDASRARVDANNPGSTAQPERAVRVDDAAGIRTRRLAANLEATGNPPGAGVKPDHLLPGILGGPDGLVARADAPRHPREAVDPRHPTTRECDADELLARRSRDPGRRFGEHNGAHAVG